MVYATCDRPSCAGTTAHRSRDDAVTPLQDLVRTLAPPLEYLAGAPQQIARAALPVRTIHEKIERARAVVGEESARAALGEIDMLVDRVAASERDAALAAIRRMLDLLGALGAAGAATSAAPPAVYTSSASAITPQLEALRMP